MLNLLAQSQKSVAQTAATSSEAGAFAALAPSNNHIENIAAKGSL